MGYTIDESMNFAQDALMWTNVADGMVTVENSTNMLISTMKARQPVLVLKSRTHRHGRKSSSARKSMVMTATLFFLS